MKDGAYGGVFGYRFSFFHIRAVKTALILSFPPSSLMVGLLYSDSWNERGIKIKIYIIINTKGLPILIINFWYIRIKLLLKCIILLVHVIYLLFIIFYISDYSFIKYYMDWVFYTINKPIFNIGY